MTAEEFCRWLHGFFELGNPTTLDAQQTKMVKDHLQLVFNKVTPTYYPQGTYDLPDYLKNLPIHVEHRPICAASKGDILLC